ncbi:hypothetical protein NM688_g9027 [Phlebia brevispora]|uniref:Uncharacterized protein n=1 Tax=Phlebia brevispora TaxID=194682 RepID=A0ACC1RK68_9APHY|nr:hypothetical protein NM688_g9027 [Phlebia brevispora]
MRQGPSRIPRLFVGIPWQALLDITLHHASGRSTFILCTRLPELPTFFRGYEARVGDLLAPATMSSPAPNASLVLSAVADRLDGLAAVFRSPRLADALSSTTVRASAALAALFIVLRYWTKKSKTAKGSKLTFVTDFSQIARKAGEYGTDEYDVIIIGGGTAGCVLAARLSEDPTIRVLLLEAGESQRHNVATLIPSAYYQLQRGPHDYTLFTEKQVHAGGYERYWPRAKLLGGCSNLNALIFHAGAPSDYDEWAELQKGRAGALGWSYKQFQPYFAKFEKFSPNPTFPDVDDSLRSAQGPMHVGHYGHHANPTVKFVEACEAAGIPLSHDLNTHKGTIGATKLMTYINSKGIRCTTDRAYLTAEVLARPNLKVATSATVTRILFDKTGGSIRANGVEFQNTQGVQFQAAARKEVVVSAGAVHTPQILMLSGVGPAVHLSDMGIPVVADLPGVGSHLKDHPVVDIAYMDKSKTSLIYLRPTDFFMRLRFFGALLQYQFTKQGPFTTNVAEAAAFIRSDDPSLFPPTEFSADTTPEDTTTAKDAPDLELFVTPITYKIYGDKIPPNDGKYNFMTHAVVLRPKSTGTICLKSKNPTDLPLIDPKCVSQAQSPNSEL